MKQNSGFGQPPTAVTKIKKNNKLNLLKWTVLVTQQATNQI